MTATLEETSQDLLDTGTEWDADLDEPKQCDLVFRKPTGEKTQCPNTAEYDVIAHCDNGHESVRHWCKRCLALGEAGKVDCRVCRAAPLSMAVQTCPLTIVVVLTRGSDE